MDLGIIGLEGLVGSDSCFSCLSSYSETKHRLYGSDGFLKEERSGSVDEEWWNSKMAKTVDLSAFKEIERSAWMRSDCCVSDDQKQEQMPIFASPKSDSLLVEKNSQNAALPYPHHKSSAFSKSEVYGCGSLNYGVSSSALTGLRGPFTPSQWMELEHQALIYKYMTSNIPVPSHLLLPIRKALHSAALSCFSGGFLRPIGWGSFQLGFSNNADPEPGRCRRTDGKKWRCSREAVADRKYCERHMNRGRHRSRKPVEGLSGHSVAENSIATNGAAKLNPSPPISAVVAGGGSSHSPTVTDPSLKTCLSQPSVPSQLVRSSNLEWILSHREKEKAGDKTGGGLGLSMESPAADVKSEAIPFIIEKQQISFVESEISGFGVVSFESLLNPCLKDSQHSLCQFTNPTKNQCNNRTAISWPDLEIESEITQLTMSSAFPANDKLSAPPGRDSARIDLGIERIWATSIGGPLGEVLHKTNNYGADNRDRRPTYGSSPTGVLQTAVFNSLSNSSGGNSSRADSAET